MKEVFDILESGKNMMTTYAINVIVWDKKSDLTDFTWMFEESFKNENRKDALALAREIITLHGILVKAESYEKAGKTLLLMKAIDKIYKNEYAEKHDNQLKELLKESKIC